MPPKRVCCLCLSGEYSSSALWGSGVLVTGMLSPVWSDHTRYLAVVHTLSGSGTHVETKHVVLDPRDLRGALRPGVTWNCMASV